MTSTNKPGVASTKICDTTSGRDESEAENQAMEVDTDYDVLEFVELDKITSGANCGAADVQKLIINNNKNTKKKTRIDQSEFDISNNMETLENHNDEFEDVWNEFVTEMKESLEEENPADVAVDDYDMEDANIFEEVLIDTQTKQSSSCSFESLK